MTEDSFWDLFSDTIKENLISMDNLFQKKIDNLIMNNEYSQNTAVFEIIKKVKNMEFSEKENDLRLFYNVFERSLVSEKNANLSKTSNNTRIETNNYDDNDDDELNENEEVLIEEYEEYEEDNKPLIKKKRTYNTINTKDEDS